MRQNEPDPRAEYFDVVEADGTSTGRTKRRSDVHQDGDWHCAFHCWVVTRLEDREPAVLFQRRSLNKDTYPDRLDVAVGGHYRAGEGFNEVVREIEEELGIAPPVDSLVNIGRRWAEAVTDSWIDREIEDVYVHCLESPVETLHPAFEEITAVDLIAVSAIESLFAGSEPEIGSLRFLVGPDNTLAAPTSAVVILDDFIPVTDGYWVAGSRAAIAVLQGEKDARLDLRGGETRSRAATEGCF